MKWHRRGNGFGLVWGDDLVVAKKEAILPVEKIQALWGNSGLITVILRYHTRLQYGRNFYIAAHPCAAREHSI